MNVAKPVTHVRGTATPFKGGHLNYTIDKKKDIVYLMVFGTCSTQREIKEINLGKKTVNYEFCPQKNRYSRNMGSPWCIRNIWKLTAPTHSLPLKENNFVTKVRF